ncbi:hypothetical protein GDO81_012863 [Engystomops pustulosus]|uniref:Uncharacterized protein n=1 Tax=Engystomops pustulosus TaxID=76066 RepID=A0AAV7AW86_ENGPU|nr:hypothetical protein GDO81_012863 [Engystomops pustulosus]
MKVFLSPHAKFWTQWGDLNSPPPLPPHEIYQDIPDNSGGMLFPMFPIQAIGPAQAWGRTTQQQPILPTSIAFYTPFNTHWPWSWHK